MTGGPLDRRRSREVDRLAIDDYGVPGVVLMENAGRGCVDLLQRLGARGPVAVCCGKGNNGGDGLVIARHLHVRGVPCTVWMCQGEEDLAGDAAVNLNIARRMGLDLRGQRIPVGDPEWESAQWIVDALLGTGAQGDPRPPLADWIAAINSASAQVLAVDLPSGLDCDSGRPGRPTVRASHTATMFAPKLGFSAAEAADCLGQVHVVDLGWTPRGDDPWPSGG